MLRFFRNIRRKLLDKTSMKKYTIYAIGEIFLVMMGILLAIQVNDWNNQRIEKKMEQDYLSRLLIDLTQDSVEISGNLERVDAKIKALEALEKITLAAESWEEPIFFGSTTSLGWAIHEGRSKAAFEEMISSGHLRLIRNPKLRKQIGIY